MRGEKCEGEGPRSSLTGPRIASPRKFKVSRGSACIRQVAEKTIGCDRGSEARVSFRLDRGRNSRSSLSLSFPPSSAHGCRTSCRGRRLSHLAPPALSTAALKWARELVSPSRIHKESIRDRARSAAGRFMRAIVRARARASRIYGPAGEKKGPAGGGDGEIGRRGVVIGAGEGGWRCRDCQCSTLLYFVSGRNRLSVRWMNVLRLYY
jgi:hypothetical protein